MKQKYDWPKIGDRFGKLAVEEIYQYEKDGKKLGKRIRLVCDCGAEVKNKVAYQVVRDDGIRGCYSCRAKERGVSKRVYGDGQARHAVWFSYKEHARKRGIPWEITREEFFECINKECVYCGEQNISYHSAPKTSPWQDDYIYTGIDRIDSSIGYTKENIQPCCKWCNIAKSNRLEIDFLAWAQKVVDKNRKVF